jgi:predicted nucleotidyltransferase
LKTILEILHQQVPMLAERYSVEKLEVFGSYVRDEQKKDSDLDVLVTFKEAPSLLTFIAIENYLSDLLGIKVDLVMTLVSANIKREFLFLERFLPFVPGGLWVNGQ